MNAAWLAVGSLIVAVCVLTIARANRASDHPGIRPWSLLVSLLGATAAGIAVVRTIGVASEAAPILELGLIAVAVFASVLWIGFAIAYTGRGPAMTTQRWGGLATLGCLAIASTTATWFHHVDRANLGLLGELSAVSTSFLQIGVFSLGLLGVVLIARSTAVYDDLPVRTGAALVSCGLAIALLPYSIPLDGQFGGPRTTTVAVLQIGVAVGAFAAIERGEGLFDRAPTAGHLARATVLETTAQPVLVVDRETRVLDLNVAARATFDVGQGPLRTRRLDDVTGLDEGMDLDGPVSLATVAGQRSFLVRRSTITNDGDTVLGYAYRFRDVTDRRASEQRLQVLDRVIRHNLRNDLDAIRGFSEPIRDGELPPDDAAEYFDRIGAIATDLVELADAIERSDRLLAGEPLDPEPCDLASIAEDAAVGQPDHEIAVNAPAEPVELRTDPRVVRLVLDELLDNAVEHADSPTPTIEIAVAATDDGARIEVRDDGPGIPDDERAVLREGSETAIAHGSGVGLWLVNWAATRLGGTLAFASNQPRGSVVTVRLPDLDRSPDEP